MVTRILSGPVTRTVSVDSGSPIASRFPSAARIGGSCPLSQRSTCHSPPRRLWTNSGWAVASSCSSKPPFSDRAFARIDELAVGNREVLGSVKRGDERRPVRASPADERAHFFVRSFDRCQASRRDAGGEASSGPDQHDRVAGAFEDRRSRLWQSAERGGPRAEALKDDFVLVHPDDAVAQNGNRLRPFTQAPNGQTTERVRGPHSGDRDNHAARHARHRRQSPSHRPHMATLPGGDRRSSVLLRLQLLDLLLQALDHVGVAQRGDVAERAALGDVAQQPAHDLARARLRQVVGPDHALGARELADPLGDRSRIPSTVSSSPSTRPAASRRRRSPGPVSSSCWPMTAASATVVVRHDR